MKPPIRALEDGGRPTMLAVSPAHRIAIARRVLADNGGVAHLQRFRAADLTGPQVASLVHLGIVHRPRIGWYADPALPDPAKRAIRVGGLLGCVSAAASWGIVVPEGADRRLHVAIEPGTTRLRRSDDPKRRARAGSEADVRWHWEGRAAQDSAWRVSPVDSILQMASCVGFRWLVAAIDSARCIAQHPAIITEAETALIRASLPERLRSAVDRSDPGSETSGETFVRLECEERGIPFEPNRWLTTAYRPDGTVDGWLPVEIDGMSTHSGREAVERDHERDATIALYATPPLRFTQSAAVRDTAFVGDVIEAVWRRGSAETGRRAAG